MLLPIFGIVFFCSCSAINQGFAILRTPKDFIDLDNSVRIENNIDVQFGKDIHNVLPNLIDSIEMKEHHKFMCLPSIYVCNSNKSFCKYSGANFPGPRAKVTPKGLFISPRLKDSKDWYNIIYHELSHVILLQNLGTYHYLWIPVWFHEGLATYVSNGGGSGDVTDSTAILDILQGNHFDPVAKENTLFPKSFSNKKIRPWMQYRQAMLFVKFLKEGKEKEFDNLLNSIFKKNSFSKSIEFSYGLKLSVLWDNFIDNLQKTKNQSSAPEEKNAPNTDSQQPKQAAGG
jgi:hypothetical protein